MLLAIFDFALLSALGYITHLFKNKLKVNNGFSMDFIVHFWDIQYSKLKTVHFHFVFEFLGISWVKNVYVKTTG